jgi:single-stranded-DNA-specific exonuclease
METPETKRWQIRPTAPEPFVEALRPLHPVLSQVLYNRGLVDPAAVASILEPTGELTNPFKLVGVTEAVRLIRRITADDGLIVVYGDYDADGVTAVAVLVETLRAMGARVKPYIPSREEEGYGLNREAIEGLVSEQAQLLITVDCGIRSLDEVALARKLGMRVIVTDHHHVGTALPCAEAVINPRQPGNPPDVHELAGVGVAFKLAQALIRTNSRVPLQTTQRELAEEDLLDLVALGTVADMVDLLKENHTLVARGLKCINAGQRPGLSALMRQADIRPGSVTTRTISFALAPRLNAAGRVHEAMVALDLLLAPDMAAAVPLAQKLDQLNVKRREIASYVRDTAYDMVVAEGELPPLIFAASETFPSGVVGLVASRLLDEFYRPAVVVSVEADFCKGSARSIPEFHITEALDRLDGMLVRHGGHAAAAGFTVATARLMELRARLLELATEAVGDQILVPTLAVDAEVPLSELSWELYRDLERLQPFGFGNPVPVLVSRRLRVLNARAVGAEGRHLKLDVADQLGKSWDAIAFRQGHWISRLPSSIDLAYVLEKNEWRDQISLQLNVQDLHPADVNADWM